MSAPEPFFPEPGGRSGLPRVADLLIAFLALLVTAPLLVIAALAIKLGSGGPVIFPPAPGRARGEEFELWKLRTMVQGSDPVGIGTAVAGSDPRITKAGAFLRRFSLDELPNLVNVLRGELAIVGPRPTIPAQVELYSSRQRERPRRQAWTDRLGSGQRPRRARLGRPRIELDVWYVENRSFGLDLRILARTAKLLLSGKGLTSSDEGLTVPEEWQRKLDAESVRVSEGTRS